MKTSTRVTVGRIEWELAIDKLLLLLEQPDPLPNRLWHGGVAEAVNLLLDGEKVIEKPVTKVTPILR